MKIRHYLCIFAFIVTFATVSIADSAFAFIDTYGVYLSDGTTPVPAGSLVQLIWTSDNAYHPAVEGQLDAAGYLTSGDYIFYQGSCPANGGWLGDLDGTAIYDETDTGGTYIPSGYVYARVFNTLTTSPTAGTWFVQSSLVPVVNEQTNTPADPLDRVDIAPTAGSGTMNQQVSAVPEPASVAMFGLGAVAVLFWRRRRGN